MDDFENRLNDLDALLAEVDSYEKKYAIEPAGQSSAKSAESASVSAPSRFSPKKIDPSLPYPPPKHNSPARIYQSERKNTGFEPEYLTGHTLTNNPSGKRVIYEEQEAEPIALKRARNAARLRQIQEDARQRNRQESSDAHPDFPMPEKRVASTIQSSETADLSGQFTNIYETNRRREKQADIPISRQQDSAGRENSTEGQSARQFQHYETTAKERFLHMLRQIFPWKDDSVQEVIRKLVAIIAVIALFVCLGFFIDNYLQHKAQIEHSDTLKGKTETQTDDDLDAQWAAIRKKYPDVNFPDGMNIKYAELYAINQDLVGWLTIPNTNIDTAVVQNKDDANHSDEEEDFYLHHNFYKNYDKYGNAYLDAYCSGSSLNQNNILYGHNMTDGLSFAQLEKYYTIDGFRESPIIQYSTLFEDYTFKVYAVFITNGYPSGDNNYLFNYMTSTFASEAAFESFIEGLDERKLYDTGVDIHKDDTLITLSTCSYEIGNDMGRLAVVGRLVRAGESTSVDTSKAVENENVRYPQIWYDEHKQTNPFANAYQWRNE